MTTSQHRIDISIDTDGAIHGEISCTAPAGADCRLWCDHGCDTHGGDGCGKGDALSDQRYCVSTSGWFDNDVFDLYAGPRAPLRSGLVDILWEGDYSTWTYSAEPTSD